MTETRPGRPQAVSGFSPGVVAQTRGVEAGRLERVAKLAPVRPGAWRTSPRRKSRAGNVATAAAPTAGARLAPPIAGRAVAARRAPVSGPAGGAARGPARASRRAERPAAPPAMVSGRAGAAAARLERVTVGPGRASGRPGRDSDRPGQPSVQPGQPSAQPGRVSGRRVQVSARRPRASGQPGRDSDRPGQPSAGLGRVSGGGPANPDAGAREAVLRPASVRLLGRPGLRAAAPMPGYPISRLTSRPHNSTLKPARNSGRCPETSETRWHAGW